MPRFEEYKEALHEEGKEGLRTFYTQEGNSPFLKSYDPEFAYDQESIIDHYEEKSRKDSDFMERTRYYFYDTRLAMAKTHRYTDMAEDVTGRTTHISTIYTNRGARKRKKYAGEAAGAFKEMGEKMSELANFRGDNYHKYLHQEEIMQLRLKGMTAAAVAKSKSSEHEANLKSRAKLSCNMILKDQLEHYIASEQDQTVKNQLKAKLTEVDKKITSAKEELRKNTPTADEVWRASMKINSDTVKAQRKAYQNSDPDFDIESTAALISLQNLQRQDAGCEWPLRTFLKDANGASLSYTEQKKRAFNIKFLHAKRGDNQALVGQMNMESLHEFEKMNVPTIQELEGKELLKYIMKYTRSYVEMTKKALPYYRKELGRNGYVSDYARQHPEFVQRLLLIEKLDKYVDDRLLKENHIGYRNGKYVVSKPEDLRNYYGDHAEDDYQTLKGQQSRFSRDDYRILKAKEAVVESRRLPKYQAAFAAAQPFFQRHLSAATSIDRAGATLLRRVEYDEQGNPKTVQDLLNEEWNLRWFKQWENDDFIGQEDMIAEELPHIYDNISDLPVPTSEQVTNPEKYAEVLHTWIEKKLAEDPIGFFTTMSRPGAYDCIKHAHKSINAYVEKDARFNALHEFATFLSAYVDFYLTNFRDINACFINNRIVPQSDDALGNSSLKYIARQNLSMILRQIIPWATDFGLHKNDPPKDYEKNYDE